MNVVFDFGGVLFSWQPDAVVAEVFHDFLTPERESRETDESRESRKLRELLVGEHFDQPEWLAFDGGLITEAALAQHMAARTGLPQSLISRFIDIVPDRLLPNPPLVALLDTLREQGHALYFLSNMPAPYARILEERHAFVRSFSGGVFSGDAKVVKPQAAIFNLLFERTGIEPSKSVFVDDHLPNVEASRELGMRAVHYQNASDTIAELTQLLQAP
jgi:putative hydrolase of the HAD superfamily